MKPRNIRTCAMAAIAAFSLLVTCLSGCARGGEGQPPVVPEKVLEFILTFAGNINNSSYYFLALDADDDNGADGPLPVAAGPQWENGWGTGSFTHFVEYHLGQYQLYRANLDPDLDAPAGGIEDVSGVPDSTDAGTHRLTVATINHGAVTVNGAGMITAATNNSFQAAGELTIETDATGNVVAATVTWTPDTDGGRALSNTEQAQVDALNVGGVALQPDSLSALGITLTLAAPTAGNQTLDVGRTVADIEDSFKSTATGQTTVEMDTLYANSDTATADPPIPGATITTGDFVVGETAEIDLEQAVTATLIGPPYESTPPGGGDTLRFTIDAANLGEGINTLSFNVITTTELIFDPQITLPNENVYDGLGHLGNRYVTISLNEFDTIDNDDGLFEREEAGDNTLEGPATQAEKDAVDIVDWSVTVRQLR